MSIPSAYIPSPMEQFFMFRALAMELLRRNGGVVILDPEGLDQGDTPVLVRPVDGGVEFTICDRGTVH